MIELIPSRAIFLTATLALLSFEVSSANQEKKNDWRPELSPNAVPTDLFQVPEGLEVTLWASSPDLFNPTNMDIDHAGRIWVCEGVNYRRHADRREGGDRVVVLEDTDKDGRADSSHVFVQENDLIAPLGIGVIDNKIYISQPPDLIVYTDIDRDLRFNPEVDKREVLLTGFNARNHDHSLHSVTAGPDGKLYFNNGNCGAVFTDRSGKTFYMGGDYKGGGGEYLIDHLTPSGTPSDDGHVWTSGFTARMNPDGTEVEIVGHGYRNSYEQTVTSRGDLFQNDNDDPPACRTSYILEYGCAGYFSRDSKRSYRAERRVGAEHWQNHWRQLDPGTMDVGDVYGGGSPTGMTYYENGALGDNYVGSLFSCEPGKNVIFHYLPRPQGATFSLERKDFATSNPEKNFDGADFTGGTKKVRTKIKEGNYDKAENKFLFRPSDITVGPDGAIYVCDWYDPRVGGHADYDDSCSGAIYRIAPKGFKPIIPSFDLSTIKGAITALSSPAINTRYLGYVCLKEHGEIAYPEVSKLLQHENPYLAARAIWLLPHLGKEGVRMCKLLAINHKDPQVRITAYRALRRSKILSLDVARTLASHQDPGVRRDVALSLRGLPAKETAPIFVELARHVNPADKNAIEAIGLGAAKQENIIWEAIKADQVSGPPQSWSEKFVRLTWRLWPSNAVADLTSRAIDPENKLTPGQREFAVESLAFIDHPSSPEALFQIHSSGSSVKTVAATWLLKRGNGEWSKYDLRAKLKSAGIYDPEKITLSAITVPVPTKDLKFSIADVLKLTGDSARGKTTAMRCIMCHEIEGTGVSYGPSLKGWGAGQAPEVIASAIIDPSSDIAHGYDGYLVRLKDGRQIHGVLQLNSDPTIITSTGNVTQMVPKKMIKSIGLLRVEGSKKKRSLMLSADQLGLSAQDVADLVAYLRSYK